jgi:hypothetical protein
VNGCVPVVGVLWICRRIAAVVKSRALESYKSVVEGNEPGGAMNQQTTATTVRHSIVVEAPIEEA